MKRESFSWPYKQITRDAFEARKDFVEKVIVELGGKKLKGIFPHNETSSTVSGDVEVAWQSTRQIYKFNGACYRVSEYCPFPQGPFIVIECGETVDDAKNNIMEDIEPFPWNLSDERIILEVKYALEIMPYPDNYPNY